LLHLTPDSKVLEVGTGSGYQAAVLAELAGHVWTIERHPELAHQAEELLLQLGYTNVTVIVGDGSLGFPSEAPYDAIIVTAAAPRLPEALSKQLGPNGRMVIPIREDYVEDCKLIERLPDPEPSPEETPVGATTPKFRETSIVGCTFVPLVGEQGFPK
jgi:protein-L-isoaspartate(D-aspartate) O-methyltransferase